MKARRIALAVALVTGLAAPLAAGAQQTGKVVRVGFLMSIPPTAAKSVVESFRQGLREAGWVEGRNLSIEYRFDSNDERVPTLAEELLREHVNVIVTWGTPAGLAVKRATQTVPIVALSGDPVGTGLVASLARPGGNVTGIASIHWEVSGKRLELLREMLPTVSRVSILWNPENPGIVANFRETRTAAAALGMKLQVVEGRANKELDEAFVAVAQARSDALFVLHDAVSFERRKQIAKFALKNRLPTSFSLRDYVDSGGLMSYGVSFTDLWKRMGHIVDKVLRGAKPADLPIEQPTKFELVINMRTARALGLTIPQSLLLRADQVIE